MPGAIWKLENETLEGSSNQGDQTGYNAAKAAVEAAGGLLQVGPGLEALSLGTFLGTKTSLVRVTNTGKMFIGGLRFADLVDPTKSVFFDVSAVATGVERVVVLPNWGGVLPVPVDAGVAGRFLRSGGAGQPVWDDVIVAAPLRGDLVVGNVTPAWDRLTIGAANTLLKSNGTDPAWGTVALLSSFHDDTLAASPVAGDLIYANATPKWARLPKGTDTHVLTMVAGAPAWQAPGAASTHDALPDTNPVAVASCSWATGTDQITAAAGSFSNVKPGWRIHLGALDSTVTYNSTVLSVSGDGSTITASVTNTGSSMSGVAIYFVSGDHWNDTVVVDSVSGETPTGAGYFLTAGRGTYRAGFGGTQTFQEIRGPVRWMGLVGGGIRTDFRVNGSNVGSGASPAGFRMMKHGSGTVGIYFNTEALTLTNHVLHFGNPAADSQLVLQNTNGSGTTVCAVIDNTALSAARTFSVPNIAGRIAVRTSEGNHTGQTAALGSQTLATAPPAGMYRVSVYARCSTAGSGAVQARLNWNDGTARSNQSIGTALDLTGSNYAEGQRVIYVASGNVTYDATFTGAGGEVYDLRVRMEAI